MLEKIPETGVVVRRSQTEAFRDSYISNIHHKLNAPERETRPRFAVRMISAENLLASIDNTDPNRAKIWVRNYIEWQLDRGGKSVSYIKSLASTMRIWDTFCLARNAFTYPAESRILAMWFEQLFAQGYKLNTIKHHKNMLSYLFEKIFGIAPEHNPLKNERIIGAVLKTMARANIESHQVTERELQAKPLQLADLSRLTQLTNPANAIYFRDLVFIALSYATMIRISEIRTLRKWQIQRRASDFQIIRVHSKTTDSPVPKTVTGKFAALLDEYLQRFCQELSEHDYIFTHLTHYQGFKNPSVPMSLKGAIDIFHRADRRLQPEANSGFGVRDSWSGHSARVGGTIDGYLKGMPISELMMLGDWRSEAILARYLRGVSQSINLKIQDDF